MRLFIALTMCSVCLAVQAWGQTQSFYSGVNATGRLQLVRVVDPMVTAMLRRREPPKQWPGWQATATQLSPSSATRAP